MRYYKVDDVVSSCVYLSRLMITRLKQQLKTPHHCSPGEALLFWTANEMSNVIGKDALILFVETFGNDVLMYGDILQCALEDGRLWPTMKVGLIDSRLLVVDGNSYFLDIETGEKNNTIKHPRILREWRLHLVTLYRQQMHCLDSAKEFS